MDSRELADVLIAASALGDMRNGSMHSSDALEAPSSPGLAIDPRSRPYSQTGACACMMLGVEEWISATRSFSFNTISLGRFVFLALYRLRDPDYRPRRGFYVRLPHV